MKRCHSCQEPFVTFKTCIVVLVLHFLFTGCASGDDNHLGTKPRFSCEAFENWKYVVIVSTGEGGKRSTILSVFEFLHREQNLRLLHQIPLLNREQPDIILLVGCGRFCITMDEGWTSGISPLTLVIYDLVRREHSAYSLEDILPANARKSLQIDALREGVQWNRFLSEEQSFNSAKMEFYPTTPDNFPASETESIPFFVVDLLTRRVRLEPSPKEFIFEVPKENESMDFAQSGDWSNPDESLKDGESSLDTLPKFLRFKKLPTTYDDEKDETAFILERNADGMGYHKVDANKWVPRFISNREGSRK